MTETIELSETELEQLQAVAEEAGISVDEAAQRVFLEGVGSMLTDVSPSSMLLKKILRASKTPNKDNQ
jgi:hypothetical protein